MRAIVVALLEFVKSIDFASIIASIVGGIGGPFGWLLALLAKPIAKAGEDEMDKKISEYEDAQKSDAAIDAAAEAHKTEMQKAKTDEEIDQAFRDGLK